MATATATLTDEQIQQEVLDELAWDARVQPNEIGVAVKDGVVTLSGWVDSYTKKWAAEEAAHNVRGVRAVANDIEVRLPGSAERTDAERIKVEVDGDKVILKGTVRSWAEKQEAERAAWSAPGVAEVDNRIIVRP